MVAEKRSLSNKKVS